MRRRFQNPSVGLRASVLAFASVLVGFGLIDLQASDGFANTSQLYTNSLTDPHSVREDFDRFGGGFGSFEVNPQNGLELLSEAPDNCQGIRVFRLPLAASRSWQIIVDASVQLAAENTGQINPWYSSSVGLVKLRRGIDGSPSIVDSAPNRLSIALARTDLPGSLGHYFSQELWSNSQQVYPAQPYFDLGDLGGQSAVLLRLRYLNDGKQLVAGYSVNNGESFSDIWTVNLGNEWNLTAEDELLVFVGATSSPYNPEAGSSDFWSGFDKDNSLTPAPLPTYSVRSGEILLADLGISYVPSSIVDFTYETSNGSEVTITDYTGLEAHVSVPQFIDGLPVTKIGPNAFSAKSNLVSVVLPSSVTEVTSGSFANSPNLAAVYLTPSIRIIGDGAFAGSDSLRTLQLPSNLVLQAERFGLGGEPAFQELVRRVGASLAENELFMAALVTNEKFLGALSAKISSRYGLYGLVARNELGEFATKQDVQDGLNQSRTQGINSVIADPNSWNLFTADQVSGLSIGDLTLTRQVNGSFVLNYDIEQSDDLVNWSTYRNYGEELTGLPINKKFIRIRVKQ